MTSAVFADLTRGAEEEARARGLAVIFGRGQRFEDDAEWLRHVVGEGRIDGVLFQPADDVRIAELSPLASTLGFAAVAILADGTLPSGTSS